MTEILTPICDLIAELVSKGLSPGDAIAAARKVEGALAGPARSSGPEETQRDKWRAKKAAQRQRKRGQSEGTAAEGISSNPQLDITDSKTNTRRVPRDVPPADDWPEDYLEQFWKAFPPYRREAKKKVGEKLARIRASREVTWETLIVGVRKFAATNPGTYAPAPIVWLNNGKWDREYGPQQAGGSNGTSQNTGSGKVGFAGIAARLRRGAAGDGELPIDEPTGGPRR